MSGYNLKEAEYKSINVSEEDLWKSLNKVFSSKTHNSSSYKFVFLKSIIDCIHIYQKYTFSFYEIFDRFTELYWTLVLKLHLAQGTTPQKTCIEQILSSVIDECFEMVTAFVPFDKLTLPQRAKTVEKVVKKCKVYVVGALYADTDGLFYSFSKKEEYITINPAMFKFIINHSSAVEELNYYELAKFLGMVNEKNSTYDMNTIQKYRQIIYNEIELFSLNRAKTNYINSMELLIDSELKSKNSDKEIIDAVNYDYDSCISDEEISDMTRYLDDPARIIKMIATRKKIIN